MFLLGKRKQEIYKFFFLIRKFVYDVEMGIWIMYG